MYFRTLLLLLYLGPGSLWLQAQNDRPIVPATLVFGSNTKLISVEAEHFYRQTATEVRRWYRHSARDLAQPGQDPDPQHLEGASNHAYLEILPDTRTTHDDKLIGGQNFSQQPGQMAVLHYRVHFADTGRYYVWVRTFSTGTEDNGLHVGIDGSWPEHGQRMQWTAKNQWFWDNRQRTARVHTGVPMQIYLDVKTPGPHEIQFSMREDGFEFDKFILSRDPDWRPAQEIGPAPTVWQGILPPAFSPAGATDKDQRVQIHGEHKVWHKLTLDLQGPFASEHDQEPNPFRDYRMTVRFTHASGSPSYLVPGYFAADGQAAESSANSGNIWRAHLSPDKSGRWDYEIAFLKGENIACAAVDWAEEVKPLHGLKGSFEVAVSDKSGRDFRAHGRLAYVGERYLQFQGSGQYFFKAGADAPETFLAYTDFDGTRSNKTPLKSWEPHVADWQQGDPVWQRDKGKGMIGALNYLSDQGVNAFSFLTYNAGGDGDNVWPYVQREDKYHFDCSKLDQWQIVFDHAQTKGLFLHFKLQETENDDNRRGKRTQVIESLDGGQLGPQRMLYYRELIARFGYLLALNWNIGEENTQSTSQQQAIAAYLQKTDPYPHHIVLHTFPDQQDKVYAPLLGSNSALSGVSLQNSWDVVHQRTLQWLNASAQSGRQWVVANDEQNAADLGVPPDPGYPDFDATMLHYNLHDIRKQTLWGNLMAGGAGVEYYFGYRLPQNDLVCEDYRSRHQSWQYAAIAIDFFQHSGLDFLAMTQHDELVGNVHNDSSVYCLAQPGQTYLVYLAYTGTATLDLRDQEGTFSLRWFNPRTGVYLPHSKKLKGGKLVALGPPPAERGEDWLAIIDTY